MTGRVGAWLEERFPIRALLGFASHKVVPVHRHSIWYYFGGMALFLFSAPSEDAVRRLGQLTEIPFDRIVESILLGFGQHPETRLRRG